MYNLDCCVILHEEKQSNEQVKYNIGDLNVYFFINYMIF